MTDTNKRVAQGAEAVVNRQRFGWREGDLRVVKTFPAANYLAQARRGEELTRRYCDYAQRLGVRVIGSIGDCAMEVTPEQAALLDAKWKELINE